MEVTSDSLCSVGDCDECGKESVNRKHRYIGWLCSGCTKRYETEPYWTKDALLFALSGWDDDNIFDWIIFDHERKQATISLRKWNTVLEEWESVIFVINTIGEELKKEVDTNA